MCVSLLMFLQNRYHITATTDIDVLKNLIKTLEFDLIIMDTDPSRQIEDICINIKNETKIPVIMTYVYRDNLKESDINIRKLVNSVFYKPYDFNEVSMKLSSLVA